MKCTRREFFSYCLDGDYVNVEKYLPTISPEEFKTIDAPHIVFGMHGVVQSHKVCLNDAYIEETDRVHTERINDYRKVYTLLMNNIEFVMGLMDYPEYLPNGDKGCQTK